MLIEIDLSEGDIQKMGDENVARFFEKISDAVYNGIHQFYLPLELYLYLKTLSIFSNPTLAAIEFINERSSELGEYLNNKTLPKLTVKYCESEFKCGSENHFSIGYKNVLNGEYLLSPTLVVENIKNDGDFYEFLIIEEAKRRDGFSVVNFNLENSGSRGNTNNMVKVYSKKKRVVVFVIDQDEIAPSMAKLKTERKDWLKILNGKNCVGFVKYTPGHELENFIPLSLVKELGRNIDDGYLQEIKKLIHDQGTTNAGDCLWLYYDIKRGIKVKKNKAGFNVNKKFDLDQDDNLEWFCEKYNIDKSKFVSLKLPGFEYNKSGTREENIIKNFWDEPDKNKDKFIKHMNRKKNNLNYWEHHFGGWMHWLLWLGCCDNDMSVS